MIKIFFYEISFKYLKILEFCQTIINFKNKACIEFEMNLMNVIEYKHRENMLTKAKSYRITMP